MIFSMKIVPHTPKDPTNACDECVLRRGEFHCLDRSYCEFKKTGKTWKKAPEVSTKEEALTEFVEKFIDWTEAYPQEVFTELTLDQIDTVCKALGFRIERISAMVLHDVLKTWGIEAQAALNTKEED